MQDNHKHPIHEEVLMLAAIADNIMQMVLIKVFQSILLLVITHTSLRLRKFSRQGCVTIKRDSAGSSAYAVAPLQELITTCSSSYEGNLSTCGEFFSHA